MNRFSEIDTWIFDLDNTLYPADCNLFAQIDNRMGQFIANHLQVDRQEARRIQKDYFVKYGTTLNGLMINHDLAPSLFLDFVHDIDHTPVTANPALDDALKNLPGRKIIFTNGTEEHAQKVTDRLGISDHFSEIYDIVATNYNPKPHQQAYDDVINAEDLRPENAAMFEDIPRNLQIPHTKGMTTILVRSDGSHPDEEFGLTGTGEEPHLHYVTNNLTEFLQKVSRHLQKKEPA